jgi:hypothetical protein
VEYGEEPENQPGLFDVWMVTGSGDRVCLVPTSGLVITPSENLPN